MRAPFRQARLSRATQLDAAYSFIHDQIAGGKVEPGAKLSRRRLADQIGVSPALVQHALGQLEQAGLVECRARSGTYVRELTMDEFANLCDVRELVEPYAAARAAERINSQQIKVLEASCRRYRALENRILKTADPQEHWRIHYALVAEEQVFHGTILAAAENAMLTMLTQSLHMLGQVRHNFADGTLGRGPRAVDDHVQIVRALKARDAKQARSRMLSHLENARVYLNDLLRPAHRSTATAESATATGRALSARC